MNDPPINDLDRIYEKLKVVETLLRQLMAVQKGDLTS